MTEDDVNLFEVLRSKNNNRRSVILQPPPSLFSHSVTTARFEISLSFTRRIDLCMISQYG